MYTAFAWTEEAERRNTLTRDYEPLQPFVLMEMARMAESEVFIDIGANIGVYSVFFSSLPSISRIVAFEAAPETFQELSRLVALNDLDALVDLHEVAVSDTDEPLRFGIVSPLSGANSVVGTSLHDEEKFAGTTTVRSVQLDDAVDLRDRRVCLKIDVEGHEPAVIAGARSMLAANRCIVQMESYGGETPAAKALEALGYRPCFRIGPDAYFSNDPGMSGPERFLRLFEAASAALIESTLALRAQKRAAPPKGPLGRLRRLLCV